MQRVVGIGGVFFKSRDPSALAAWYRDHLGIPVQWEWGSTFSWADQARATPGACTVWSPFKADTKYFEPSTAPFMLNFVVEDLDAMRAQLTALGDPVDPKVEESDFGRFGWVQDPEGNRVELWQPPKPG